MKVVNTLFQRNIFHKYFRTHRAQVFILATLLLVIYAIAIMAAITQFSQNSSNTGSNTSLEDNIGKINHEVSQIAIQSLRNFTLDRFSSNSSGLTTVNYLLANFASFLSQSGASVTLIVVPQSFILSGHQSSTGNLIVNNAVIESSINFNLSILLQDALSSTSISLIEPIFYSSSFWVNNRTLTVAETPLLGSSYSFDSSAIFSIATLSGSIVTVPLTNYYNGSYIATLPIVNTYKVNVTTSAWVLLYS